MNEYGSGEKIPFVNAIEWREWGGGDEIDGEHPFCADEQRQKRGGKEGRAFRPPCRSAQRGDGHPYRHFSSKKEKRKEKIVKSAFPGGWAKSRAWPRTDKEQGEEGKKKREKEIYIPSRVGEEKERARFAIPRKRIKKSIQGALERGGDQAQAAWAARRA